MQKQVYLICICIDKNGGVCFLIFSALRSGSLNLAVIYLLLSLPAVVICLSIHEASHGLAANLLGDDTAKNAGRLTLSPLAHIDPWGFMCLLFFGFGWARPVPVNISNFKHRKRDMALTAIAGPLSNLLLAFVFYCFYWLTYAHQINAFMQAINMFCQITGSMSVGLGVFNLIPIHPLDGSRVLDAFLPFSWSLKVQKYQTVIIVVFALALWFGVFDAVIGIARFALLNGSAQFLNLFL